MVVRLRSYTAEMRGNFTELHKVLIYQLRELTEEFCLGRIAPGGLFGK